MSKIRKRLGRLGLVAGVVASMGAGASDIDALALESAPEPQAAAPQQPLRLFVEGAIGSAARRYGMGNATLRRVSLDFSWNGKPAPGWRLALSNRLDDIHPQEPGARSATNSLREAFVGWQDDPGRLALDAGRINLRLGPAYGFNPTDYFRDGSSRVITTVDPLALRDNRMGTVMLRAQRFWDGGSVMLALAPKLQDEPSDAAFSPDLGATNHSDRALLVWGGQAPGGLGGQLLAFYERGKGWQLGANMTTLLSDAAVGFLEWSGGRDAALVPSLTGVSPDIRTAHRLAAGLTYTTESRVAVTAEFQYNGFAADDSAWAKAPANGPQILGNYLAGTQLRQDAAPRRGAMLYATQRGVLSKRLDLTGLVRWNADDRSRFVWVEARYRWPQIDLALQLQQASGRPVSEYGVLAIRRAVQITTALYF